MKELSRYKWKGFLRPDGRKGIRNKVLVIYTVECSSFVAKAIGDAFKDDVDVIGFGGCTDNNYAVQMLLAMTNHPNIGGVLAVGLGCEYVQPEKIVEVAKENGRLADGFFIQDHGGTKTSIEKGIQIVSDFLITMKKETPIADMGFSDLVIGSECGGSDYTSGLAGNVVVGKLFDYHVSNGGTAIFEEIVEAVGLRDLLGSRGKDDISTGEILATYDKAVDYCKSVKQYSISPGNFVGGITTIEEKSMGAVIKSGTKPIEGVIKVSEKPKNPGLWLMDSVPDPHYMGFGYTNPNDSEGLMDLISAGCQIVLFVTGRGTVVGSAISPALKITGNHKTYENLIDDMDFDASPVLDGQMSIDELTIELADSIVEMCKGNKSKSEKLGHKEYFVPYKYQTQSPNKRC